MSVLVTIGALALVALWAMSAYGRLVGLRNQVTKGWRQVAVQLKRRHELIANLVNTVTGAVEFEGDTLEAVVAARTRAASASGPADASRKESELSATLGRFFALAQSHPELIANQNLRALQQELAGNENTISAARQFYNKLATKYNNATEAIPGNIIAGFAGFKAAELFEITSAEERAAPSANASAGDVRS
jgi:LemA protein